MRFKKNPTDIDPQQMLFRPIWPGVEDDLVVKWQGRDVGTVCRVFANNWEWTLAGLDAPQLLYPLSGATDDVESAKSAVKSKLEAWHNWAVANGTWN